MEQNIYNINYIGSSVYLTSNITDNTSIVKHFVICRCTEKDYTDILNINNINNNKTVYLKQIHSNKFYVVDDKNYKDITGLEGDAIITYTPMITLKIFTADCVPVTIFDEQKNVAALVHAGWKGTNKRILYDVVMYLIEKGSKEKDIKCILGPSIGPCCFEVGDDVAEMFKYKEIINNRYHVDLWKENKMQLIDAKIPESNIFTSRLCTCCNNDLFYSYRKEGKSAGRIVTYIQLMKR